MKRVHKHPITPCGRRRRRSCWTCSVSIPTMKKKRIVPGFQIIALSKNWKRNQSSVPDTWLSQLTSTSVMQEVEGLGYTEPPEYQKEWRKSVYYVGPAVSLFRQRRREECYVSKSTYSPSNDKQAGLLNEIENERRQVTSNNDQVLQLNIRRIKTYKLPNIWMNGEEDFSWWGRV